MTLLKQRTVGRDKFFEYAEFARSRLQTATGRYLSLGSWVAKHAERWSRQYFVPLGTKLWYSPTNASSLKVTQKIAKFF